MSAAPTFAQTYGAMFLGLLFATFLQGVLTVQLYHYFCNFPKDNVWNKFLVSAAWCLDLVHLVLISSATYHYLVTNWGNPEALAWSTIPLNLHLIFIGASTILCQSYFLNRVWLVTNKNIFITGIVTAMCLTDLALYLRLTVRILGNLAVSTFSGVPGTTLAAFVLGAISDVSIAVILCLHLRKGKGSFKRTNNLISKLISYAVATGAATSALGVACAIVYIFLPNTLIYIALHFSVARMYTNALLATLNSRKVLRATVDGFVLSSDAASRPPHTPYSPYSNVYNSTVKHDGSLVLDEVQLAGPQTPMHKGGVIVTKHQATHTDSKIDFEDPRV